MIVTKLDNARKIFIPRKLCNLLKIKEHQEVELTIEYGCICIKKFDSNNIASRPHVGVVRYLDAQHRVVIPKEYLNCIHIELDSKLQLDFRNNKIIIKTL